MLESAARYSSWPCCRPKNCVHFFENDFITKMARWCRSGLVDRVPVVRCHQTLNGVDHLNLNNLDVTANNNWYFSSLTRKIQMYICYTDRYTCTSTSTCIVLFSLIDAVDKTFPTPFFWSRTRGILYYLSILDRAHLNECVCAIKTPAGYCDTRGLAV